MSDWREMFQGGAMSPAMAIAAGLISGSGRSTDPAALQKGLASGMMNAQQAQALLNKEKADRRRMELQEAQQAMNQERLNAALEIDRSREARAQQQYTGEQQRLADQQQIKAGMRSGMFGDGTPPVDGVGPSRPGALAEMQETNPLKAAAARMAFESGDAALLGRMITPEQAEDPRFYGGILKFHDGNGGIKLMQPSNTGELREIKGPEGYQPLQNAQWIDAGGQKVPTFGGRAMGNGTIDVTLKESEKPGYKKEVAAASKEGAAAGQASFDLAGTLSGIKSMRETINGIITHEALPYATGRMRNITGLTAGIKGGPLSDFDSRMDQLEGGAFLQASEKLSGVMTESDAVRGISDFSRARNTLEPQDLVAAGKDALLRLDQAEALAYEKAGKPMPSAQQDAPLSDADLLKQYGIE